MQWGEWGTPLDWGSQEADKKTNKQNEIDIQDFEKLSKCRILAARSLIDLEKILWKTLGLYISKIRRDIIIKFGHQVIHGQSIDWTLISPLMELSLYDQVLAKDTTHVFKSFAHQISTKGSPWKTIPLETSFTGNTDIIILRWYNFEKTLRKLHVICTVWI